MTRRSLALLLISVVVVWSGAAIAQALDPALPLSLPSGQAVTWPLAVVMVGWQLTGTLRDAATRAQASADRLVAALERVCDRDRPMIRIAVDQCPARIPSEPTGPLRIQP